MKDQEPNILTALPELTVSQVSQSIKTTIEGAFSYVRIRGELSRVTLARSGHLYTDLKDENSVLNAVCWKGSVAKLSVQPEEGLEVICTGRITTYPGRSNYQLVITSMELAGQGALLKMLEQRKKKLAAEGLFDQERKKTLSKIPRHIGIITSPTGAVIRDILHRLKDRFPRPVTVWPANMQGTKTVVDVVTALRGFNNLPREEQPDLIIVARGGGSLEDLMPFNDEEIVRAVGLSDIPVISAIGHETDTTLIDFVADQRAPTPTAAAEMAVPVRSELIHYLTMFDQRMGQTLFNRFKHYKSELNALGHAMGDPRRVLEPLQQRFDYASQGLNHGLEALIRQKKIAFEALKPRLSEELMIRVIERLKNDVSHQSALLNSFSYKGVLKRGFALVTDQEGHPIQSVKEARSGRKVGVTLNDGQFNAVIE